MKLTQTVMALAVAGAMSAGAQAQNLVSNSSFETVTGASSTDYAVPYGDAYRYRATTTTQVTGWTTGAGSGFLHLVYNDAVGCTSGAGCTSAYNTANAQSGSVFVDLTGGELAGGVSSNRVLQQTLTTVANTTYTVDFYTLVDSAWDTSSVGVNVGFGSSSWSSGDLTTGTSGSWVHQVAQFTATGTSTVLSFQANTSSTTTRMLGVDNVTVTAVSSVPEPESYALFLSGLGVLGLMAQRRRRM